MRWPHLRMKWCINSSVSGAACGKSQCRKGMMMRLVFSEVKVPVEKSGNHHGPKQCRPPSRDAISICRGYSSR